MQKPYGRLDVFWPEGQFQTFPLADATVTIGRSSGNTIPLESDNISRYHFKITCADGHVTITDMDSANGTYVDGVRLPTDRPQPLYGGEEIQIGDLRILYTNLDDSPTRPMVVPEETTQRIELEAPAFRIDLHGPDQPVAPGAHISAELAITNTGRETERYVVEVNGLPADWVRIDRARLDIAPGKRETVVISFKPVRRYDSAPGDYPVLVSVRPDRESVIMLNAELTLTVLPFGGFGMALEKRRLGPDGRFHAHLHNQGSANLPLTISVRDPSNALRAIVNAPRITLAPGQRFVVQGRVQARRRAVVGEEQELPFDVVVRSEDAAHFVAAQRAYVTDSPPLPRWAPLAMIAVAIAAAALVILGLAWLSSRPVPPVITEFAVSSTRVAQGEPLVVSWSGRNVSSVAITVNGTPVFTEDDPLNTTSTTINTNALEGEVVVALAASGADTEVTASEVVTVIRPMRIDLFTVNPPTLVRNVVQTIDVAWSVPGAARTRITGLEAFTTASIEPSYGSEGRLTGIPGIPQGTLHLSLYAEDASGNAIEQSINVDVVDPFCASLDEAVTLRAGPSLDQQVVGTVPTNTTVVVDARDESGQWLRVLLSGGVEGWGPRTALRCADNFAVENLRQVLVILTPPPTAEATEEPPTATPEPLVTATPRPSPTRTPSPRPSPRPTSTARGGPSSAATPVP